MTQNPCASMPSATLNFERLLGRITMADSWGAHLCRSWQIAAQDATQAQPARPPWEGGSWSGGILLPRRGGIGLPRDGSHPPRKGSQRISRGWAKGVVAGVQELVRRGLKDRRLPEGRAVGIRETAGDGQPCNACDQPIGPKQKAVLAMVSLEWMSVRFHVDCYKVWDAERLARSMMTPPS